MTEPVTDPLLEHLRASYEAVVAENGALGVSREAFCAQVINTIEAEPADARLAAIERLVLRDVHLVMACLAGEHRALRLFKRRFGRYLRTLALRSAPSESIADDVESILWSTLFTPRHVADPTSARLYGYQGRGTLQGWLRVTARRMVIDIIRRQRPESREGELDRLASPGRGTEADLVHLEAAARLRPVLHDCIEALSADERTLMSQYYREGRVLREIGADLGIDTSSVFRRLGSVRRKVWKRFRVEARTRLGLSDGDLRGLLPSIAHDLDLDELFPVALLLLLLAWNDPPGG